MNWLIHGRSAALKKTRFQFLFLCFGILFAIPNLNLARAEDLTGGLSILSANHQWKRILIPVFDSRPQVPEHSPAQPKIEIALLPYESSQPKLGAILMIPGFFQNANSFDLLPAQHISFARYLSKAFHLQVYFLHVRGLGNSSLARGLNLDDFAIDDLPTAIDYVAQKEQAPVFVFGNSQGGIMLQASLSGLTRCRQGNCFDETLAGKRQSEVRGLAISAGSVALSSEKTTWFFPNLLRLYHLLRDPLQSSFDYISINDISHNLILRPLAQFPMWSFLYNHHNVSPGSRTAMLDETLEASWTGVILQFGVGIEKAGVRTESLNSVPYTDGFKNIKIPTVQVTYELDPLAEPTVTERDSYAFIGSGHKHFFVYPNQSHEDYLMSAKLHHDWDLPFAWLLNPVD